MRKKASKNLFSFFLANRELNWFWIGTSMVATTFSADTPLAIAGITATQGISGNWFWWSWILTYITITVFFSRLWWRSEVMTDVEFTELRYSGKSAQYLRFIKAFYFSILLNGIILGWIFLSLHKILIPFINQNFDIHWFMKMYPESLVVGNYHTSLLLLFFIGITILYSSLGGVKAGIFNDMFQFIIAMGGAILFAFLAVDYVGGISSLKEKLMVFYPDKHQKILSFFPDWEEAGFIILIYFTIQWWTQYYSDGTGYLMQRMNTAKNEKHALLGSLWFAFANFAIRTWPWVFVGLVGLVLYPENSEQCNSSIGSIVCKDREMIYPFLIQEILSPIPFLKILLLTGLIAAFMSTVETHLHWGASYITNDFYKRYFKPNASQWELVFISKMGILLMAIIGIISASHMNSIETAWKFLIAISAGIGFPQILRWFWWRANAWTEISGMIASFLLSIFLYGYLKPNLKQEYYLFLIASTSIFINLVVTLMTKPVDKDTLEKFFLKVKPNGFWKPVIGKNNGKAIVKDLLIWIFGNICILSFMLSIGYFIFQEYLYFTISFLIFCITSIPVLRFLIDKN